MVEGLKFPKHEGAMFIQHNEHLNYYQPVAEYIEEEDLTKSFRNPEELAKSVNTGELWVMQWYPDTPVGFIKIAAPTWEGLLEFARMIEAD